LRCRWHQRHGKRKMNNPFEEITARLDALAVDVRALKSRTMNDKPADEIGGIELFCEITGYAKRTGYKLVHFRQVPHFKRGGKLYFRRSELEQWIDAGRRRTVAEVAVERMAGNK